MLKVITNHPPPREFLTTYDVKTGVEMFDLSDRWILKLLAKLMNVWIYPVLSTRYFHQWGGAKMMLREVYAWIKPGDFVYKTDVYSYYASLNHTLLIQQLTAINWTRHLLQTVITYCKRTIFCYGPAVHCQQGIPKGGSRQKVSAVVSQSLENLGACRTSLQSSWGGGCDSSFV